MAKEHAESTQKTGKEHDVNEEHYGRKGNASKHGETQPGAGKGGAVLLDTSSYGSAKSGRQCWPVGGPGGLDKLEDAMEGGAVGEEGGQSDGRIEQHTHPERYGPRQPTGSGVVGSEAITDRGAYRDDHVRATRDSRKPTSPE